MPIQSAFDCQDQFDLITWRVSLEEASLSVLLIQFLPLDSRLSQDGHIYCIQGKKICGGLSQALLEFSSGHLSRRRIFFTYLSIFFLCVCVCVVFFLLFFSMLEVDPEAIDATTVTHSSSVFTDSQTVVISIKFWGLSCFIDSGILTAMT